MARRYCIACDDLDEALRSAIQRAEARRARQVSVDLDAMATAKVKRDDHRRRCHVYQQRTAA
jgi:hypothetical protein